ncbi:MAG: hypothetical protein WA532_12605 [Candidatus Korobacteraceae bacterium]
MGALPFLHPRVDTPTPDPLQKAPQELPTPELIATERSHLLRGLLIASLLATPFWIALGIVLYLVFR